MKQFQLDMMCWIMIGRHPRDAKYAYVLYCLICRCSGDVIPNSPNMMLRHWVNCPYTKFSITTKQLMSAKGVPVTNRVDRDEVIKEAIPGLYTKLCTVVHQFPSLGGPEERAVVIPKAVECFNEVDRIALANLVATFNWPYNVSEDYDVASS